MKYILTLALFVTLVGTSTVYANQLTSVEEVQKLITDIESTMFPDTAVSTFKLSSLKDDSVIKSFAFDMYMEDTNNLLLLTWPALAKAKILLKADSNLWMYFKDVKRSIRISSKDSFMGTDANNYDLMELNLLSNYSVTGFDEIELDGKSLLEVKLDANSGSEGYSKIISLVDPVSKRILQHECFSISGRKIKTIEYRETFQVGKYNVPSSVLISSAVNTDRSTLLEISNVRPQENIDDELFTLGYVESLD